MLRCAGEESEARLSFVGLNDLIGDTADGVPARAAGAPARGARGRAAAPGQRSGRGPEPKAVAIALRSLLVEVARAAPVVVAVDDVQWLDAATVAGARVRRAAARAPSGRRARDRARAAALRRRAGARAGAGERAVRAGAGSARSASARSASCWSGRLGHRYRRPDLVRIERVTGGNPLFALEIARALGPAPALEPGGALPVPASLQEAVAERVAALPPRGRESLLVVAALSHADRRARRRRPRPRPAWRSPRTPGCCGSTATAWRSRTRCTEPPSTPRPRPAAGARSTGGSRSWSRTPRSGRATSRSRPRAPTTQVAATLELAAAHARARGAWDAAAELLEQAQALTSRGSGGGPPARRAGGGACTSTPATVRGRGRCSRRSPATAPRDATRGDALRLLAEISYHEDSFAEAAQLLEEALDGLDDRALAIVDRAQPLLRPLPPPRRRRARGRARRSRARRRRRRWATRGCWRRRWRCAR